MGRIKAIDGAVLRMNGVAYPIVKGTEFNVAQGNTKGIVATDTEIDGDGTSRTLFSKVTPQITDLVVSLKDEATEDSFLDLQSDDEHKVQVENGDIIYSIEKGTLLSPNEGSTIKINHTKRITEAFEIRSTIPDKMGRTKV